MTRCLACLLSWLLWVCLGGAGALAQPASTAELSWDIAIWRDLGGQAGLAEVRQASEAGRFSLWDKRLGEVNLAHSPGALWLRVTLDKPADQARLWVLELPFHGLDTLDIHLPNGGMVAAGASRSGQAQLLQHRFPAVSLELEDGINVLYLRAISRNALTVPVRVWLPREFLAHVQASTMVQAFYFGGLAVMVLYNLFLAISLGDRRFFSYVLFASTLFAGMFSGNGYGRLLLWPDAGQFDAISQSFFLCLSAALSIDFSRHFLQLRSWQPRMHRLLQAGELLLFGLAALLLLGTVAGTLDLSLVHRTLSFTVLPLGVLIMVAAVRSLLMGVKGVRFFVLAWSVLWLGVFVATLRILGWLPSNDLTMYAIQIASAAEMLLLALALAEIVHQERAEREQAQTLTLQLQEQMVLQLRQSEERLDQAVKERTRESEEALARQGEVLEQYVRFGALISHEFRNPLSIIQSQVSLLRKLVLPDTGTEPRLESIMGATRRLKHLFDRWLQGGRLHLLGEDLNLQPLQLWPWVQDLLTAYPQYTANHQIVLEHDPHESLHLWVHADESLLESAVVNLLDNACKYSPAQTQVRLFVRQGEGRLGLCVQDQGPGISAALQASIFDEYTRGQPEGPVRGLGLGLALVKRIADLMQGSIELHSTPGQGSCFCLWLAPHPAPASP